MTRHLRVAALSATILLGTLSACTSQGTEERTSEEDLTHRLESLDAVDKVSVETEEFDSESYWTTVQVTMEPDAGIDEVTAAIDLVEESRDDFADYSGSVALAASEADATVDTGGEAPPAAEDRAARLLATAGAVPDAATVVSGDDVIVTTPDPTAESLSEVGHQLAAADDLAGVALRVQTADPYDDEEGAPVLGMSGEATDLERLPTLVSTAQLALQSQAPAIQVGAIRAQGPASTPGLSVRLVKTDFRGTSPKVAKHRRELWPVIRTLIDLLIEQDRGFHLQVEAGPAHSSGTPFIDVRTDTGHPTYSMAADWRRLVARHLRQHG